MPQFKCTLGNIPYMVVEHPVPKINKKCSCLYAYAWHLLNGAPCLSAGKFREEFRRAFQQCWCESWVLGGDAVRPVGAPGASRVAGASRGHVTISMAHLHRAAPGAASAPASGRPAPGGRSTSTLAATATTAFSVSVLDSRT